MTAKSPFTVKHQAVAEKKDEGKETGYLNTEQSGQMPPTAAICPHSPAPAVALGPRASPVRNLIRQRVGQARHAYCVLAPHVLPYFPL